MGTLTDNLNLYKPANGETGWGDEVSANFDVLDTAITSAGIANVVDYGADPTGVADSSVAIRAACAAAKRVVFPHPVDPTTYIYDSGTPLVLDVGHTLVGLTKRVPLVFSGSAAIEPVANNSDILLRNMWLATQGPDLFTLPSGSEEYSIMTFENCLLDAGLNWNADHIDARLIYGTLTQMIFCRFLHTDFFAPKDMVDSAIQITSANNANCNKFYGCTFGTYGSPTVPFISAQASGGGKMHQWAFRDIACEGVQGGLVAGDFNASVFDNIMQFDAGSENVNDFIDLGSGGGTNVVRSLTLDAGMASGKYYVNSENAGNTAVYDTSGPVKRGERTKLINSADLGSSSPGTVYSDIYMNTGGVNARGGLHIFTKAGAITDGDFDVATDGLVGVDTSNNRFYVRHGGSWHYSALT